MSGLAYEKPGHIYLTGFMELCRAAKRRVGQLIITLRIALFVPVPHTRIQPTRSPPCTRPIRIL
jgi:hypothetical protein